jgi:hypothetical protein
VDGQGIQRGPDGATGVEHVVDQDNGLAVDTALGDLGGRRGAGRLTGEIVAIHGHVERSDGTRAGLDGFENRSHPPRKNDTARGNAENDQIRTAATIVGNHGLKDLVGNPSQRAFDVSGLQNGACSQSDLLPRLSGRNLKDVCWEHDSSPRPYPVR